SLVPEAAGGSIGSVDSVGLCFYLQANIKHHRGDEVEVGEPDPEPPGQVEEYEQGSGESFREQSVGSARGAREPQERQREIKRVF
uniref:Uncharacterized protein n=1 Tax=Astyanax mexicanus TaxID=7994 RepID=A0A8B9GYK4_ASTMX